MLAALRGMEQTVLKSSEHSDTEGIVLRYGIFYGPDVPHDELFTRLAKWWALPAMTGTGIVSWVHIDDVAKATADAVERGRPGQLYNIVDDPAAVVRGLCTRTLGEDAPPAAAADRPPAGGVDRLLPGDGIRTDLVAVVQCQGEGRARLDAYSPVNSGARFSNIALMPSVRSLDGKKAEFHAAT